MLDPTSPIAQYLVTQSGLGAVILGLLGVVTYFWREMKSDRKLYDAEIVAERNRSTVELSNERARHEVEITAERKLNVELQEQRINELRVALDAVKTVTAQVDTALAVLRGRMP